MLTIKNNFVIIETANTTYAMMITPHKDIQHIYYGKKLNKDDIAFLVQEIERQSKLHAGEQVV